MKAKKRETPRQFQKVVPAKDARKPSWPLWAAIGAAIIAAFWAYGPAMHGPFLFDDRRLPFALPGFQAPLRAWLAGLRPVLMFSYWVNAQISSDDPYSYHVVNVVIHLINGGLIFLIARRLLEWAGFAADRRGLFAAFAAFLFLLHPVNAEAVAYLAGRSEALSVLLVFTAFTIFLYRPDPRVNWLLAFVVLVLYGASVLTKEHTIVLPGLLLLTDYWWNPGFSMKGMRGNWRIYAPIAVGAVLGFAFYWKLITTADTAGFGLKDFTWYQYFFTQCRALFIYLREFIAPVGLNTDWDFPISRTIFDHGAIIGFLVLIALSAAAWYYRRRFPLATFGWFTFLLLMAPTSSILPIRDPIAERRLYFAMIGLLLILVDALSRVKVSQKALSTACAALLLLFGVATHARAALWSDEIALWSDAAENSPNKVRDRFWLATAYYDAGQCDKAITEFANAAKLPPVGFKPQDLLLDWALAYDCNNQPEDALGKLRQAAALEPSAHIYSQIAMVYAKRGQWADAMDALAAAEKLDGNFAPIYVYRGGVHVKTNHLAEAVQDYQRALALDPTLDEARKGLVTAEQMLARSGH